MSHLHLKSRPPLFALEYATQSRHALAVINSKAHFPLFPSIDLYILHSFLERPEIGYIDLLTGITSFKQKRLSEATLSMALKRLLKAGYIERNSITLKYSLTLAGSIILHSFNDTLEHIVGQKLCALADRMEAEANK